jgi:hypothetical protein
VVAFRPEVPRGAGQQYAGGLHRRRILPPPAPRQIERVFAAKAPIADSADLREDAAQGIKAVGADVDLDALTPDEMLQIQAISSGSDSVDDKRRMIEQLAD